MTRIDIVVPVRNEAANIPRFVQSVEALNLPPDITWTCLFVEDGSTDATVDVLRQMSAESTHVEYFSLANGFGQGPAIIFGISRSSADAIVMMDADGSCPVEAVPEMIRLHREGAEVVQCLRRSLTGRSWVRDAGSAAFVLVVRALTGRRFEDQNIYFRLVSQSFAREILKLRRYWRFARFPLPSPASGRLAILEVDMKERVEGESTYSFGRLAGLVIDGVIAFLTPRRLLVQIAVSLATAGLFLFLGHVLLAMLLVVPVAAIGIRFVQLQRTNYLEKLVVVESSVDSA